MDDQFRRRRLVQALEKVPVERIVKIDWDTDEGFAFLRECRDARKAGYSWDELISATGIEKIMFVYLARERLL